MDQTHSVCLIFCLALVSSRARGFGGALGLGQAFGACMLYPSKTELDQLQGPITNPLASGLQDDGSGLHGPTTNPSVQ